MIHSCSMARLLSISPSRWLPAKPHHFPTYLLCQVYCPLTTLMNTGCEPGGKPISINNYSRRCYLHSVLQWTCLWGSTIVTWITHYVLRHCTLEVSKHLLPSKPNVLILLPSLLHPSLLLICLHLFCTLGATTFWEETLSLWLGKVSINYCGTEGKSVPRITNRRLLHKPVQAATLNDLTGSLSFPIYYSIQRLNQWITQEQLLCTVFKNISALLAQGCPSISYRHLLGKVTLNVCVL